MIFSYNLSELFIWENGIRLVSWLFALFLFWRINKLEYVANQFYKTASIMFIGVIISQLIAGVVNISTAILTPYLWIFSVIWVFKKLETDWWPLLDSLVVPLLIVLSIDILLVMVDGLTVFGVIQLLLLITYLVFVLPWSKNNYRIITWYPSGKKGFIFLMFIVYWQILSLVVAFSYGGTLYLSKLILALGLLSTLVYFYRRSSCDLRSKVKDIFKNR